MIKNKILNKRSDVFDARKTKNGGRICFAHSLHSLSPLLFINSIYGKKTFLSKESDTLKSYRVHISPTM